VLDYKKCALVGSNLPKHQKLHRICHSIEYIIFFPIWKYQFFRYGSDCWIIAE